MRRILTVGALLAAGTTYAASIATHGPVNLVPAPEPTVGSETHKVSYFGYPDADSVFLVTPDVDRGAAFSAPTDYPAQRHTAFSEGSDTYYGLYEWNAENNFRISMKYWQAVGPIGFWSFQEDIPEPEGLTMTDMGRPSALGMDSGVGVGVHGSLNGAEYDSHWAYFDGNTLTWTATAIGAADGTSNVFPFLDQSSDGTLMMTYVTGEIADPVNFLGVAISNDNGASWTTSIANSNVNGSWRQPSGASDPNNGDLYLVYQVDVEPDLNADVVIQRSADGGATWTDPQVVASGVPGGQTVQPSAVVDRNHSVHLVFQGNVTDSFESGGLQGFGASGPSGVPWYASGSFDGDTWTTDMVTELNSRENLAGIDPAICGETNIVTMATDSLSGIPLIGIHYADNGDDVLYATYGQPIYAEFDSDQGGYLLCGSWQVWMQKYNLGTDSGWQDRTQVSNITNEQIEAGRAAIYPNITHDVPASGPGIVWSEMDAEVAPASVYYNRPEESAVGIGGDLPGAIRGATMLAQNAPNPFNPSTVIRYETPRAIHAQVSIFDALGRRVTVLADGLHAAGSHAVRWNGVDEQGRGVPSGVYFSRLEAGDHVETRTMLLVK